MQILRNAGSGYWEVSGGLDIESAGTLKTALLDCFLEPGEVVINLSGVDHCDANGLQLLIAAQHTAEALGRAYRIQQPSDAVSGLARNLGLLRDGSVFDQRRRFPEDGVPVTTDTEGGE
jgi:anti-anti-sigma factor